MCMHSPCTHLLARTWLRRNTSMFALLMFPVLQPLLAVRLTFMAGCKEVKSLLVWFTFSNFFALCMWEKIVYFCRGQWGGGVSGCVSGIDNIVFFWLGAKAHWKHWDQGKWVDIKEKTGITVKGTGSRGLASMYCNDQIWKWTSQDLFCTEDWSRITPGGPPVLRSIIVKMFGGNVALNVLIQANSTLQFLIVVPELSVKHSMCSLNARSNNLPQHG